MLGKVHVYTQKNNILSGDWLGWKTQIVKNVNHEKRKPRVSILTNNNLVGLSNENIG